MTHSQPTEPARLRLAVVDDDESFLRSIARLLRSVGYAVKTFESGRELLASLPGSSPQCLVLDIHMPEMTGFELQDRIVAQGFRVPVIFVTACDTPETRARAHHVGSFGLLVKPFDKQSLFDAIGVAVSS